ncbi:MAG: hypothetical protein BWY11_00138 [Firmicutes bacterium ADurb.Bin182]|nr:MAG: hypothetical protein BWY11_00138 [Firmicutes bacterium ADurb.Bin182]
MSYVLEGYSAPPGVASKEDVLRFQRQLNAAGADLKTDGIWGPKTQAAYERMQSQTMGLMPQFASGVDIKVAYDKAAANFKAALDSSYRQQELRLNEQAEELARRADEARSRGYVNARLEAIGNNEALASLGLAGSLYDEPRSGVSETSRIARDIGMRNDINAVTRMENELRNEIALQLSQAGLTRDYEYALKLADLEIAKTNAERAAAQQEFENRMAIAKWQSQTQGGASSHSGSSSRSEQVKGEALTPEQIDRWLSLLSPSERGELYMGIGEQNKVYRKEIIDSVGEELARQMMRLYPMNFSGGSGLLRER